MVNDTVAELKTLRAIGLVPPFFKPGYATVPGVCCNNYAVVNVASVAACMQLCKLPAPPRVDRVTDVNGHETRQVDERLNPGPGNEATESVGASVP